MTRPATPRATPRKPRARSQVRIDSILDAARTLLAAEGVSSLSIYSVAQRAAIAPSSVYHFFPMPRPCNNSPRNSAHCSGVENA